MSKSQSVDCSDGGRASTPAAALPVAMCVGGRMLHRVVGWHGVKWHSIRSEMNRIQLMRGLGSNARPSGWTLDDPHTLKKLEMLF
jgi:hypothetical protein